jgi:WXG100 family type VII secretion target
MVSVQSDFTQAASAKTQMANVVAALQAKIKQVTTAVDGAEGGWKGTAFQACQSAASAWDTKAATLNSILDDIHTLVGDGNTNYNNLENDNQQALSSLANAESNASSAYTSLRA